jgi:hypothetical protein
MERTTPAGGSSRTSHAGLKALAVAAALAAGPMLAPTSTPVRAAEPTPQQKQQIEQDKRAATLLNDAKQAYEQKNFPVSVQKYREFVGAFPKRPEVSAAKYGMAMAMAELPDKDWNALATELGPVIASPELKDKGRAQYWLGVALRVTGEQQLAAAQANPAAKEPIAKALARIGEAATNLAAAQAALTAAARKPAADAKELPPATEVAARAKVEAAEAFLKVGKNKEAEELVSGFATDPVWSRSTQRPAALLALGQARVALGDHAGAFAALAQLAPFDQLQPIP